MVKLYLTQLLVSIDSVFTIAFKNGVADSPTHMQVALSFNDAPSTWVYFDVGSTTDAGWNTREFDLEAHDGRTIGAIALVFDGDAADDDFEIKIGRLGVIEGVVDAPAAPSNLIVDDKVEDVADVASLRLKWDPSSSEIYYYNIYRRNPDKTRTYLGGTTLTAHLVPSCDRVGDENSTTIEVEAVSPEFGHSSSATTTFTWGD